MVGQSLCSELTNIVLFFFLLLSVVLTQVLTLEKELELGAASVFLSLCAAPSTQSLGKADGVEQNLQIYW